MNKVFHPHYLFDEFILDLTRGCLMRGREEVKLRPKSFKALTYLVENRGRLINKEELIGAIWPDVTVTDDSLVQCLIEIRKALGGDSQRYIKTTPRRGYIFDAQVRLNGPASETAAEDQPVHELRAATTAQKTVLLSGLRFFLVRLRDNKKALAAFILALALLSGIWYRFASRTPTADSAGVRSIAVLPFKEIGSPGSDELLGLGMTDTLITKLSNAKEIVVRSTSAVRSYAKPDQDPIAAGIEQEVDAVLDGSIQRSGEQIRVSVQLLRVKDAKPLWAERFDEKLADIFTMEDSIAQRVVE